MPVRTIKNAGPVVPVIVVASVYMLRHAESVGNVEGYDAPDPDRLTDAGRDQADGVAKRLSELSFDRIACSPLRRAKDTIRPYLRAEDEVAEIWGELREACWQEHVPGDSGSLRYGPDIELTGEDERHFALNPHEYPARYPPEDETYHEGFERIRMTRSRILEVARAEDSASLLLVGHGYAHLPNLCELLMGVEPDGPQRFSLDNVGLAKLERESNPTDRFRVRYWNRTP